LRGGSKIKMRRYNKF